ncbi:MAG: PrsW family glutamic-type intramembrane protease [Parahaliea sp.]
MASSSISFLLGTIPVLFFLIMLRWMDGFRLVPLRLVCEVTVMGGVVGLLCVIAGIHMLHLEQLSVFSSYWLIPLLEESVKAAIVLWLFRQHRIGFLVDAAILGFAVGAGFAIVENLYYVMTLKSMPQVVWLVRGFGTAIMHGGVTAVFAIATQLFSERNRRKNIIYCLPGLLMALSLHWLFNRFYLSPITLTLLVVSCLPAFLVLVFLQSAHAMRSWLQQGLDGDLALIELLRSGEVSGSRMGEFLTGLRERFDGSVLADMLCYLRLYTELGMRTKGVLMMRQQGFAVGGGEGIEERLTEMDYLEKNIGCVGMLALKPLLARDWRSRWQMHLVSQLD